MLRFLLSFIRISMEAIPLIQELRSIGDRFLKTKKAE